MKKRLVLVLVSFCRSGFLRMCMLLLTLLSFPSGFLSGHVTLKSIEIYTTHEWFAEPTIYFECKGENKTYLPDVKNKDVFYAFKGQESWQPLTEIEDKKCKRCGLYEEDLIKTDTFDEWELCPDDFATPEGLYLRYKAKEFNASFLCPQCVLEQGGVHDSSSSTDQKVKKMNVIVIVVVGFLASSLCIICGVLVYKYWQRKKREQDQARFLKLFEEDDDIDAELGLENEFR